MQINYALALLGMIATGVVASPVPEAQPEAEAEAVQARAEQAGQFIGYPFYWRGGRSGFNRFMDNDFLDILKRNPEALDAHAEQAKRDFGGQCGWGGCGGDDMDFANGFQDDDFIDILKRDASGLQARAEQAEQATLGSSACG